MALSNYMRMDEPRDWSAAPKRHTARNIVLVLAAILVIAAGVLGFLVHGYVQELNSTLEAGEPNVDESVLSPASYDEPFYMLVLGVDTRDVGNLDGGSFSDAMILTRMDLSKKTVTMVSIARDTRWENPDGSIQKINHAFFYGGMSYAVQAVEELTGVEIAHFMIFDVSDMEEIVDAVGGVTVNVEIPMKKEDINDMENVVYLEPGVQTLNGLQAQVYARDRFAYESDGEAHRQSNIRTLMQAVMHKALDAPKREMPGMLMNLAPYLHTDLRAADFASMAWRYATSPADELTLYNGSGPSNGDFDEWYDDGWYCFDNPEGWATLMAVVNAGGNPEGINVEDKAITHEARHEAEEAAA